MPDKNLKEIEDEHSNADSHLPVDDPDLHTSASPRVPSRPGFAGTVPELNPMSRIPDGPYPGRKMSRNSRESHRPIYCFHSSPPLPPCASMVCSGTLFFYQSFKSPPSSAHNFPPPPSASSSVLCISYQLLSILHITGELWKLTSDPKEKRIVLSPFGSFSAITKKTSSESILWQDNEKDDNNVPECYLLFLRNILPLFDNAVRALESDLCLSLDVDDIMRDLLNQL
jgi:hypothetical protein